MLLSAEQLTKSYGDRVLLDGVSFYLERGDKVGIIGVNGAGKSTLLRLLAGAEEPDGGTVRLDPGVRMEYLPQNPVFQGERTVLEQVLLGLNDADRSLAEYEARTILNRLGVSRFEQSVGNLSGGERRRVALAAVLARPCDVLILDEPTNHLDNDMVLWLEDYLRAWKGALVMVTHDRYFLERIVGRMAEVEEGRLHLDLSEQYGGLSGVDLTVADACLTLTLCQVEGVESVYVTVEGREIPYRRVQQLGPDGLLLTDGTDVPPEEPEPSPTPPAS